MRNDLGWKNDEVRLYSTSAGIAGCICNVITNPLWLMRTRMQVEIFRNSNPDHFDKKYSHGVRSLFINMQEIVRIEGFRSLWKGLPATFLGILHPLVFFPIYEKLKIHFKSKYEPNEDKLSTKYIMGCSMFSKFIASGISYPHEVLRARIYYHV